MGIPLNGRGYRSFEFEDKVVEFNWLVGDSDFVETMGFRLRHGRTFSTAADTIYTLLNETAAKWYAFDENLQSSDPNAPDGVIGIVQDFNFETLHNEITPVVINYVRPRNVEVWGSSKLLLKVKNHEDALLSKLEDQWKDYFPDVPFEYTFLSEEYRAAYDAERKQSVLIFSGSVASIAITTLGVIGLLFFSTHRRSKEMAIRKVHGASSVSIVAIFLRQILAWIALASLVSLPLALYFVTPWMNNFVYKADLPFFLFSVRFFA
jgi:putative ABC transport system permease protein